MTSSLKQHASNANVSFASVYFISYFVAHVICNLKSSYVLAFERTNFYFIYIIWQQTEIDDMQFRFIKGNGTTDAIFIVRRMQENFRAKEKKLYFGFVDLEKAFDGVLTEVIKWAEFCKIEECLANADWYSVVQAKLTGDEKHSELSEKNLQQENCAIAKMTA